MQRPHVVSFMNPKQNFSLNRSNSIIILYQHYRKYLWDNLVVLLSKNNGASRCTEKHKKKRTVDWDIKSSTVNVFEIIVFMRENIPEKS